MFGPLTGTLALVFAAVPAAAPEEPVKPLSLSVASEVAKLFRLGKYEEALKATDQESLRNLDSSLPWLNGALIQLEMGRPAKAHRSLSEAILMGDRSNRRYTVAAEIDVARGQFLGAQRHLESAEFQDPEDPYTHLARAKFADATGADSMAERSRWQAYRFGRLAFVDSKEYDAAESSVGFGSVQVGQGGWRFRQVGPRTAILASLGAASSVTGGDLDAQRESIHGDFAFQSGLGVFSVSTRDGEEDRPTLNPDARLSLRRRQAGWQGRSGAFTVQLGFREAVAKVRTGPDDPFEDDSLQSQWLAEVRWDQGPWTAGLGVSDLYRRAVATPAIEPFGDQLPDGRTRLGHAYAILRSKPAGFLRWVGGLTMVRLDDKDHLLVSGELAVKIAGQRYARLGVKPTMNRIGTMLFPEDLRGRGLRQSIEPNSFALDGKSLNAYLRVPLWERAGSEVAVEGFQTEVTQALFPVSDPELATQRRVIPVRHGTVRGVTLDGRLALNRSIGVFASATSQSSRATYGKPTQATQLPNLANLKSKIGLDATFGETSVAVTAEHYGERTQFRDLAVEQIPFKQRETWLVGFSASHPMAGGTLRFDARNLGARGSVFGAESAPSFVLHYTSRF